MSHTLVKHGEVGCTGKRELCNAGNSGSCFLFQGREGSERWKLITTRPRSHDAQMIDWKKSNTEK